MATRRFQRHRTKLSGFRADGPVLRPNPFTQALVIVFALPEAGAARVSVHDAAGRRVALVAGGRFAAGTHQVTWDGHTDVGGVAPTGVYFVRIETPAGQWTRKAVRMN
jgi:flagellar hook assembly protein FlgD